MRSENAATFYAAQKPLLATLISLSLSLCEATGLSRAMFLCTHVRRKSKSISSRLPDEVSDIPFFLSGRCYSAQPRLRFLVFPRNRALIHPESPGHPRPSKMRLGIPDERKAGTGPLCQRENTRTSLSRCKSPSLSHLVALSSPAPPLANPPTGCLHSAVPPPTSLYSPVRCAVCLYSAVGQLLAPRLVDTPDRCSSIFLGGHGLG
jgi:hypothetical protein